MVQYRAPVVILLDRRFPRRIASSPIVMCSGFFGLVGPFAELKQRYRLSSSDLPSLTLLSIHDGFEIRIHRRLTCGQLHVKTIILRRQARPPAHPPAPSSCSSPDLERHKLEVSLPEIGSIVSGAKPEVKAWRSSWDTTIYTTAKGVVLIIGPWNYPYVTTMFPLIGAITAGCACVIKPSGLNPVCAALPADPFPRCLDPTAYRILNSAARETTALLELRWDHIFFTASGRVGRIIAAAATKHSPVFVSAENTDIKLAPKRILSGKQQNAGQIYVAPDYVLVPRPHQDAVVTAFKKAVQAFSEFPPVRASAGAAWPDGGHRRACPVPLVIYVFTGNEDTKHEFFQSTSGVTLIRDDTLLHLGAQANQAVR
ncbi:Aldehyde/histidinol dehydrogenase [Mycena galericulata]|nr:Aldehyde/histidinol dehydrogenase [Mycena galericulata]